MVIKKNWLLVLLAAVIEILFFVANEKSVPLLSYAGVTVLLVTVVLSSGKDKLYLLFFLLPNQRVITMVGSNVTLLNIIIIALVFSCIMRESFKVSPPYLLLLAVLILYSLVVAFWHGSIFNVIVALKVSLLIFALMSHFDSKVDFVSIATPFVLGSVVAALLGLFFYDIGLGQRFDGGAGNNANIFGASISFALACVSLLAVSGRWKASLWIPASLMLLFSGLLTQSRSFLLCLLIVLMITFFTLMVNGVRLRKYFFISLLFLVLLFFVGDKYLSVFYEPALLRVSNPRNDDISGSRFMLWQIYFDYIMSSGEIFLFGVGSDDVMEKVGVNQVAHNGFIETMVAWGGVGLSIALIIMISFTKKVCALTKAGVFLKFRLIGWLPILVLLSSNLTGHSILSIGFIAQMFIGGMALKFFGKRNATSLVF